MIQIVSKRLSSLTLKGMTAALMIFALAIPSALGAPPSEDDIERAKAAEEAAAMSVAQIEVELANVTAAAAEAVQASQIAAEELNGARIALEEATAAAKKATENAEKARADYEQGRHELASVAQTAYRSGGSALDTMAPYFEADGLRAVESRQVTLDTFGSAADVKMQRVAALEQVAEVMEGAAERARAAQEEATAEVEVRAAAAREAADQATAVQANTEMRRSALVEELAVKQGTTVALIEEREAALEAARQAAAAEAARRAAEAEAARRAEAERQAEADRQAAEAERQAAAAETTEEEDDWTPAPAYTPPPEPSYSPPSNSGSAWGAIDTAKSLLGAPYVWAGEGPGYDCSGLVTVAYRSQGVYLPHWSVAQYNHGASGGAYVPLYAAEPGDLVFWSSNGSSSGVYHVAIYLGNDQIIEAPTFGVPVRITGLYNYGALMPYAVRV